MAPKPPPSIFMPRPKRKQPVPPKRPVTPRPTFDGSFDDREDGPRREEPEDWQAPPLLYEGNYNEWIDKASTMLVIVGCQTLTLGDTPSTSSSDPIRLIRRYVRKQLLDRVPDDCKDDVSRLMIELKKVAKPFRLMDLPSEVRVSIHGMALQKPHQVTLISTPNPHRENSGTTRLDRPPPLTMVSRAVREEAMPLYYQLNTFRMSLNHLSFNETASFGEIEEVIQWAMANKIWLKHLRKLVIGWQPFNRNATDQTLLATTETTYLPNSGVGKRYLFNNCDLDLVKGPLVRQHEEQVESFRRFFGLEGEALPMLWTDDVRVWMELGGIKEGSW